MGKFEKFKYFLMGVFVMLVISTAVTPSLAASTVEQITVYFDSIKIYVDDTLIQPKDATGKTVEPFTFKGTTYLPVRAIADALGKSVVWDGQTNSVYLGKHDSAIPAANLTDMDYFDSSFGSSYFDKIGAAGVIDNTGAMHTKGVVLSAAHFTYSRTYLINQKYTSFKGKLAVTFNSRDYAEGIGVNIYGDDKLLYSSPIMASGIDPVDFNVDVSGVARLKIEWHGVSENSGNVIFSGLDFYNQ